MPTPTTKPSTQKLSDAAREVVAPKGVVSTGWPAVKAKCRDLGIRFRWWQEPIGKLILAKRADGKYAATIGGTGLSIPRQVGKTFLVGAIVFALCLLRPGLTVIWTAHRVRTAEETFGKMQAFAKRKKIAPHIAKVVLGSGEEAIEFTNRSRILFGARATGFGRGFDEVDVLIFDEAQILTEASLDDMIPATNQSRQETSALLLFMGTPPKPTDPGEVFTRMRDEALSGEDDDTAWIEFGADPGFVPTEPPAVLTDEDWEQVAKANPSFPEDTPREAILRMRKKLGHESYQREGLGLWDDIDAGSLPRLISLEQWSATGIAVPPTEGVKCFGIKFAPDGSRVAVAGAFKPDDGSPVHIELVGAHTGSMGSGTTALVTWCADRWRDTSVFVIDGTSHAGAFVNALRAAGVPERLIHTPTWGEVATGNALLLDAVLTNQMTHLAIEGQAALDESATGTGKKMHGEKGAWSWLPVDPTIDEIPISAASLALLGSRTSKRRPGKGRSGTGRRAVVR